MGLMFNHDSRARIRFWPDLRPGKRTLERIGTFDGSAPQSGANGEAAMSMGEGNIISCGRHPAGSFSRRGSGVGRKVNPENPGMLPDDSQRHGDIEGYDHVVFIPRDLIDRNAHLRGRTDMTVPSFVGNFLLVISEFLKIRGRIASGAFLPGSAFWRGIFEDLPIIRPKVGKKTHRSSSAEARLNSISGRTSADATIEIAVECLFYQGYPSTGPFPPNFCQRRGQRKRCWQSCDLDLVEP